MNRTTTILIGPGFGLEDTTKVFLTKLFNPHAELVLEKLRSEYDENVENEIKKANIPLVLDADGLKLISKIEGWAKLLTSETILTPHPGEMAILTGLSIEDIQANRIYITRKYSTTWGHVVVLKGAYTIIAAPDGQIAIVPVATAALAKAGTGDVLAGLIAGLRAQGLRAFQAACAGAWIHANAGLLAARRMGNNASVLASDVLNAVPQVVSDLLM